MRVKQVQVLRDAWEHHGKGNRARQRLRGRGRARVRARTSARARARARLLRPTVAPAQWICLALLAGGDAEQAPPADDAFGAPAAPVEDAFGAAPVEAADPPAAPMDSVEPANDGGMDAMDQMEPPAAAVDQMPEPAAVPDIPEVPEVNKLTEWEAAWNVELEQKNAEAETLVTTNRSRAQEELERFREEVEGG